MNDRKLFQIKNFIKDDDGSTPRLQSLRLPRDLSLGGNKQSKKLYKPNLNVVRNKDKTKEFIKQEHIRRGKNLKDKHNAHNNNKQSRFIQSSGVFSEGAGEILRSHNHNKRVYTNEKETPTIPIPTINLKKSWNEVDDKSSAEVLAHIMNRYDDSDEEKMGFEPLTWCENELNSAKLQVLKRETVKSEVKREYTSELPYEYQFDEALSDSNPNLTVWSLPDSLAGKGLSDDPNVKKLFDYQLKDMLEGKIGKICVRRSGKMELYIGRIKYDLLPTEVSNCEEDLMALNMKNSYNESAAAVLGKIKNRFLVTPDWNTLFK